MTIAYVTNNYSSTGMVQLRRFGHDDGADTDALKWAYVSQGSDNIGVAGVGRTHCLKPGCRVQVAEYGNKDGSIIVSGVFGRMGSGTGDGATSYTGVNTSQSDFCIPLQNPTANNGTRCQVKAPDGRYHKKSGGQPLDLSNSQYPTTQYKT